MARTCHTEHMEQRTDLLTATYVDLAVNVAIAFGLAAGMRVLQYKSPFDLGAERTNRRRATPHLVIDSSTSTQCPWLELTR